VPVCTGIFPSAYCKVGIVLGTLSSKDGAAGEERGKLKTEGWAGDQLPLPAYHSRPANKNHVYYFYDAQLGFQRVVLPTRFIISFN
jgi:hypothetical protein